MTKKTTGVLKNVMQEDRKGCKKNNTRRAEEQITAPRTKRHEDEEVTGIRPAGRENKGTKRNKAKRTKHASKTTSVVATAFALPPLNSTKTNQNYSSL